MRWSSWNKADKTLLAAAVIFVFALCVHLEYRNNVFADGFLFCAEAALVGGIADWFAVTALFRKPLGFPYHTAILPRRRQAFIGSSVAMVQQEFFSKRKLFQWIRSQDFLHMLLGWLAKPETQTILVSQFLHYARSFVLHMDRGRQARVIADQLKKLVLSVPQQEVLEHVESWLRQDGHDRALLQRAALYLQQKAAQPEARRAIEDLLEEYQKQRIQGTMASFLAGLAQAMNLVNFEEAAELMQQQVLAMLKDLGTDGSELQTELLELFYEKSAVVAEDEAFRDFFVQLRESLIRELPLEEAVESTLQGMRESFLSTSSGNAQDEVLSVLRECLLKVFSAEVARCVGLLCADTGLQREIDRFLYDMVARTALAAQTMVGVIVKNVLNRLTDAQLNHLVYDKVEPDLLWIRMNGSIVGSGIGLCLFVLLHWMGR